MHSYSTVDLVRDFCCLFASLLKVVADIIPQVYPQIVKLHIDFSTSRFHTTCPLSCFVYSSFLDTNSPTQLIHYQLPCTCLHILPCHLKVLTASPSSARLCNLCSDIVMAITSLPTHHPVVYHQKSINLNSAITWSLKISLHTRSRHLVLSPQ